MKKSVLKVIGVGFCILCILLSMTVQAFAKHQYTVKFIDGDTVLSEEHVMEGEDATPPPDPSRDGKTFIGWQGEYANVSRNTIVLAKYKGEEPEMNVPEEELMADPSMSTDNTIRSLDGTPITDNSDKDSVKDNDSSKSSTGNVKNSKSKSRYSYDPELKDRVNQSRDEFYQLMKQEIGNKYLTLQIVGITVAGCILMLIIYKIIR